MVGEQGNDLDVLDINSFDSDIRDDSNSARRVALRELKKQGKKDVAQSRIVNYFFIGQEFPNTKEAKKRIKVVVDKGNLKKYNKTRKHVHI
nr:zinc finger, SWIM-type [Tanacetum cinerariifolium]